MALYDPDAAGTAAQYLRLPSEELLQVRNVPFTAKTAVWIPHSETAYTKGEIMGRKKSKEAGKGDKIEVKRLCDGKIKKYSPDDVEPQNPPKYELLEDIANLTYLSEASVVHDLGERYRKFLIYTYSGLFCVTVNPYKMLPIFENHLVACYQNKRKTEMPPHLWSVADNAYNDMLRNRENQSLLITGNLKYARKTVYTRECRLSKSNYSVDPILYLFLKI